MATKIADLITLDGTFGDWPATDMIMTSANTATGYQVYGAFLNDATLGNTYVIGIDATDPTDPVIVPGTIIYLNTDQNDTTGYELSFANIGAEYEVQFALDATGALQPYLYSVASAGATTLLNGGAPLDAGFSSDGESVELAIPQALLTPAGGTAATSINLAALINGANGLPTDLANDRQPDHARRDIRRLADGRHRHDTGKRRRRVSSLRRLSQRFGARQHLRDRPRRDRVDGPGHRARHRHLFECRSK
jgi:hypothetical protein